MSLRSKIQVASNYYRLLRVKKYRFAIFRSCASLKYTLFMLSRSHKWYLYWHCSLRVYKGSPIWPEVDAVIYSFQIRSPCRYIVASGQSTYSLIFFIINTRFLVYKLYFCTICIPIYHTFTLNIHDYSRVAH